MSNETLVQAEGLVKQYGSKQVVKGVDLNISRGEIVGLLGPNGAGKTTTFYMIMGLVKPTQGSVYFEGQDVTRLPMYKRARLGMGYLAQEPSIFRKLTVEQNVMAILETLKIPKRVRLERLDELLEALHITHVRKQKAFTLSGGERRRLEITRAMVNNPSMILLDEPFSGVDPIAVDEVQHIVRDLRDMGLGILITDHSVRETLQIVDRAYLICEGSVLREGDSDFLINDEVSRELYLGPRFDI